MMKYKCGSCGVMLETDDSLSGQQEACPSCGEANSVPVRRRDVGEQRAPQSEKILEQREERTRQEEAEARLAQEESQRQCAAAAHAAEPQGPVGAATPEQRTPAEPSGYPGDVKGNKVMTRFRLRAKAMRRRLLYVRVRAIAACLALATLGLFVWPGIYVYREHSGPPKVLLRINRFTQGVSVLATGRWVPMDEWEAWHERGGGVPVGDPLLLRVSGVAACLALATLGLFVWPGMYVYRQDPSRPLLLRINRFTRGVSVLWQGSWVPMDDWEARHG